MRVLVVNHVSLDGVLQGPGRPGEDTCDGFRRGGWAREATDPAMFAAMGEQMGEHFFWLFGPDDEAHPLRLVDCTPTATGVLMATYRPHPTDSGDHD